MTGPLALITVLMPGDHEIIPEPGAARRVGDRADLLNPAHYLAEASASAAPAVRCERFYLAEWRHIAPER
jgi:hypothetical protein